jgi:RimJ/RimL family protein N-acetyltransferase
MITFDKERCAEFMRDRYGITKDQFIEGAFEAVGLERDGEIIAACIYNHFTGFDICMHIAAKPGSKWCTKSFLYSAFAYPFKQLGCLRVTGYVAAKDEKVIEFDKHLGFVFEGVKRCALPDDDLVILGMTRAECRFIEAEAKAA